MTLLPHAQQLHLEDQRGVRRDHPAGTPRAIAEVGGDGQLALAAYFHAGDPLVPALDDMARSQREREGPPVVLARIELGAVLEPAGVVDVDGLAGLGFLA